MTEQYPKEIMDKCFSANVEEDANPFVVMTFDAIELLHEAILQFTENGKRLGYDLNAIKALVEKPIAERAQSLHMIAPSFAKGRQLTDDERSMLSAVDEYLLRAMGIVEARELFDPTMKELMQYLSEQEIADALDDSDKDENPPTESH